LRHARAAVDKSHPSLKHRNSDTPPADTISFCDDPTRYHKLVVRTSRHVRKPASGDVVGSTRGPAFRLSVSPDSLPRTLRILDALVVALESSGAKFFKSDNESEWMAVEIDGERLGLHIHETVRRTERQLSVEEKQRLRQEPRAYIAGRYEWHPTGRLNLSIISTRTGDVEEKFRDGAEKLEQKLGPAVEAFRRCAIAQHVAREESDAAARRRAEEERIRQQRAEIAENELSRLRRFESLAKQLERANRLRLLADALESAQVRIVEGKGQQLSDAEVKQPEWLRRAADWLDPTKPNNWPAVDGVSRPYWWHRYQQEMGAEPSWY
jgi:hypothetical protein